MPQKENAEEASARAAALEKRYEWLEATETHGEALKAVEEGDFFRKGEAQEKIGHCLHRAARARAR